MIEEALRLTDAGKRSETQPLQRRWQQALSRCIQPVEIISCKMHLKGRHTIHPHLVTIVQDERIDSGSTLDRLPQRPSRQWPAIHQAATIHHDDFNITHQSQMLQPIVTKNDVALRIIMQQRSSSGSPVRPDEYRAPGTLRQQQGLIAHLGCRPASADFLDRLIRAPITTADNARLAAQRAQVLREPECQGRFAGTASDEVTDHNDWNR